MPNSVNLQFEIRKTPDIRFGERPVVWIHEVEYESQSTLTRKSILAAACFCFATSLTAQTAGRQESTSSKDSQLREGTADRRIPEPPGFDPGHAVRGSRHFDIPSRSFLRRIGRHADFSGRRRYPASKAARLFPSAGLRFAVCGDSGSVVGGYPACGSLFQPQELGQRRTRDFASGAAIPGSSFRESLRPRAGVRESELWS